MKSIWFFLGLLITVTIIFLSLNRTTLKVEYFSDPSIPINSISTQLAINPSRIRNFIETGDITIPGQYNISFELHPRNIMMKSDPLLSELEKKITKSSQKPGGKLQTLQGFHKSIFQIEL
jgi:hypothetical protein